MSYDFEAIFLGQHVRKRRLENGQLQREAAVEFEVSPWTVLNWERGHTVPPIGTIPAILEYLGYDPFPQPMTLSEHLVAKRREMGWSIKEAAESIGVDPSAWGNWERGSLVLFKKHRTLLSGYLGVSGRAINSEMSKRWSGTHSTKSAV